MTHEEAEEFMREWGDWARWSDARSMVQEAYGRGYTAGRADGAKASVPVRPRVNAACGVHGPIPCEGAGCICAAMTPGREQALVDEALGSFTGRLFGDEELRSRYTKDSGGPNPFYRCVCGATVPGVRNELEDHARTCGVNACPPGHCRTPSAPCRTACIQTVQPRETSDKPMPIGGVQEVPRG